MSEVPLVLWMELAAPGSRLHWKGDRNDTGDYYKLDNGKWGTSTTTFEYTPELYFDDDESDLFDRVEAN